MIIDAKNAIVGRLGTIVAKKALLGEEVIIVNAEKAIITGKPELVIDKYYNATQRGNPFKGPFISRAPDRLLRRMIRGMLPYKKPRGKEAYKRIKCYIGVPEEFKDKEIKVFKEALFNEEKFVKHVTLLEISRKIGWNDRGLIQ